MKFGHWILPAVISSGRWHACFLPDKQGGVIAVMVLVQKSRELLQMRANSLNACLPLKLALHWTKCWRWPGTTAIQLSRSLAVVWYFLAAVSSGLCADAEVSSWRIFIGYLQQRAPFGLHTLERRCGLFLDSRYRDCCRRWQPRQFLAGKSIAGILTKTDGRLLNSGGMIGCGLTLLLVGDMSMTSFGSAGRFAWGASKKGCISASCLFSALWAYSSWK